MQSRNKRVVFGIFLIVSGLILLLYAGQELGLLNMIETIRFFVWFVVVVLFIYFLVSLVIKRSIVKSIKLRGTYGEREVDLILERVAKNLGGIEFLDLLLKNGEQYTQIDNKLLTSKALYVIETKDYSGWVFGSQSNGYWTQTFKSRQGIKKYKFYNPIMQNQTHINILTKLIPILKAIPIHNIIVFTGSANLKEIRHSEDVSVIYSYELKYLIEEIDSNCNNELLIEDMVKITEELYSLNTFDYEDKQEHITQIHNRYYIGK